MKSTKPNIDIGQSDSVSVEETIHTAPVIQPSSKFTKIVGLLLLIACALAFLFYYQAQSLGKDPSKANEKKITALVEKVSKLIDLPQGELPTIAVVSDTKALEGQPFFANAKVGDEVLLYTIAQKAYLYDPKANMILEVASLNIGK